MQQEKKKQQQQQHGERERERTKRAAEKDTARSASIADKAVADFFFEVSTACEKTNGQRRTPTVT
jgi:hypothetical protein